jgi:hypothetical protein
MPKTTQTDSKKDKKAKTQQRVHGNNRLLQITSVGLPVSLTKVLFFGGILLAALLMVSVFAPNMSERIKFFTVNALSLLVLLAIAIQAFIYHQQREVMERQLKATEQAAEASYIAQRAYIGVTGLRLESKGIVTAPLVVGETPTLFVRWNNGGTTPARNFRAIPYLVLGEKPELRGYFLGDDMSDIEASFIPGGKEVTMPYPQIETGFKPVTSEMLDDINSGKKRLYAMILASYVDFTGKDRWLESGAIYKPEEASFTELGEYYRQE